MPYLTADRKRQLRHDPTPETAGDLTYLITDALLKRSSTEGLVEAFDRFIETYLLQRPLRFERFAAVLGSLDAARREYARRNPGGTWSDSRGRLHSNYIPNSWIPASAVLHFLEAYAAHFYDEHVAPYEDDKIEQNGDVYPQ